MTVKLGIGVKDERLGSNIPYSVEHMNVTVYAAFPLHMAISIGIIKLAAFCNPTVILFYQLLIYY